MMKRTAVLSFLMLFCFCALSDAMICPVDLQWQQNGCPVCVITLDVNESATVQLFDLEPLVGDYTATIADDSAVAEITSIVPVLGDNSNAVDYVGFWQLDYGWATVVPISDSTDHWDVTIKGLSVGSYTYVCDTGCSCAALEVNVVPLPSTLVLIGSGLLTLRTAGKRK